jgi:hypothetical protein
MTAEDVFNETLKSPELQEIYNIPIDEIKNESYYSKSKHEIIEVIRTLLISKHNLRSNDAIYNIIKRHIIEF